MINDSGFISFPEDKNFIPLSRIELIHSSDGGWSELYLCDKNGKFIVLKCLKEEYRGDIRYETLLRKEFEMEYKLSHPGICEVYGLRSDKQLGTCIEMEWIDGINLEEYLNNSKLDKDLSKKIVTELCSAVAYCHSKQILHRDIKPANIMITHNGRNVKIVDFGLSDADSSSILKTSCGTVGYTAPEVLAGNPCTVCSDIYSLGKVIGAITSGYGSVVRKCTNRNPLLRYQDVGSVLNAFNKVPTKRVAVGILSAIAVLSAIFVTYNFIWNNIPVPSMKDIPQQIDSSFYEDSSEIEKENVINNYVVVQQNKDTACSAETIDELFQMATEMFEETTK